MEGMEKRMRLIDADVNREDFMERVYDILSDEPDNIKANLIIDAFDEMPTAYDPDKVVEQLEKSIQISESAKTEAIAGMCGASANYYGGAECAYERAIEIVKGGGVDGN
jgi:hypothetical protein